MTEVPRTWQAASAFCGWVGFSADPAEARRLLERMTRALPADPAARPEIRGGARSGLGGLSVALDTQGGRSAIIAGEPSFHDAALARRAVEAGAAAALLDAWRDGASSVLERLGGAFALAVVDDEAAAAWLAVDRVGGRLPLYLRASAGTLVFGSSADALQPHPRGRSELDPQGLYDYLQFHVIPGPRTARRGVVKLLPGQLAEFAAGQLRVGRYWEPVYDEDRAAPLDRLAGEFRAVLERSVTRGIAGPRTGCFLSGGTDSSTLCGMVARVSGEAPRTYSIGFDAPGYDEMGFARIAARHFGTRHREYYLRPDDIAGMIPRIARVYSEPFGNESVVPAYHCARMAREDGVDVMLGGDGGDELFAGNERYAKQLVFEWYRRVPAALRRRVLEPLLLAIPAGDRLLPVRKARSYVRQASVPLPERTQSYAYLQRLGAEEMLVPEFLDGVDRHEPLRLLREIWDGARADSALNRFLALDLRITLADNDLPKVSRMCELAGVRARYPLLDDEMVTFSLRVPSRLKMRGRELRWFFRHALRDFLPQEILDKRKHGMGTPFGLWLGEHRGLAELVGDSLADLRRRRIVRPEFLERLLEMHRSEHAVYYGVLIWILVQLEQWLKSHEDAAPAVGTAAGAAVRLS